MRHHPPSVYDSASDASAAVFEIAGLSDDEEEDDTRNVAATVVTAAADGGKSSGRGASRDRVGDAMTNGASLDSLEPSTHGTATPVSLNPFVE